jgi:P-type Cu+ transporter
VCRMQVDVATAHHTTKLEDVVYYFCCANCRARFLSDPARYRTATL